MLFMMKELLEHYRKSHPAIVEAMNLVVEKNYDKIMRIWKKTKNPVPLKKARKVTVDGRDYFFLMSLYIGKSKGLEWDSLMYSFIPSEDEESGGIYGKDLVFFTNPETSPFVTSNTDVLDLKPGTLNGALRFTGKFLELYGYIYGEEDWDVYEIAERWIRRNPCPLFILTASPDDMNSPQSCNILGKDWEGDGVCIGRLGPQEEGTPKFVAYYPEDVLEDINQEEGGSGPTANLLDNFREIVKPREYRSMANEKWPDKFMLNKYY